MAICRLGICPTMVKNLGGLTEVVYTTRSVMPARSQKSHKVSRLTSTVQDWGVQGGV
jgi:hypothetical protein